MKVISKHFVADDRLILRKEDWEPLAWTAFLAIFGLTSAEEIAVNEYKIEALVKTNVTSFNTPEIENDVCQECAIDTDVM